MKTKNVHKFLIPAVGLLVFLGFWHKSWHAAPIASLQGRDRDPINLWLSDGDSVACYPIQAQKSLLDGKYNRYPKTTINPGSYTYHTRGVERARQTMAAEMGACPDGTIPIRASRSRYGPGVGSQIGSMRPKQWRWRKSQKYVAPMTKNVTSTPAKPPHEYGYAWTTKSMYKGTEVFINLWNPRVESANEFSLGQLWLVSGDNTIEAGYQVYEGLYGDDRPRLFVYWTANRYNGTGCYNLDCPGFVQVSNKVLLGGSFSASTISRQEGQQYEIKFRVFKDDGTGDWWLQVNDEYVGYWPKAIFNVTTPFTYAEMLEWGGEIVDDEKRDGNFHTTTEMGSGKFANEGYGEAAYQRNLQYVNMDNTLVNVDLVVGNTEVSCYSTMKGTDFPNWKPFFFYGGKGWSSKCRHDPKFEAPPPHKIGN